MELKIGSKIAELRKAKGMTQEQLALALGISAPAVSKWETDNSYPDITLLCPLARALDTNVDTLLEYDEVMTEEKVKAYTNEIIKIERNGDVLLANEKLQKLLCQYPNSVSMKFHAVTLITSFQVMHPECTETQRNEWEKQKKKLLEEIYESKNPAYMNNAISALAVLAIQNNELDRAETLLKQLPENIGDITHFWVQIYLRRGNNDKALELEDALKDSNQFLFLRTTNSELRIRGNNNSIRQWCAWEIGNFYTKHKEEKYYTSFYDKTEPRNDILDTFRPMREVVLGEIR